jgi:hypothetical protein
LKLRLEVAVTAPELVAALIALNCAAISELTVPGRLGLLWLAIARRFAVDPFVWTGFSVFKWERLFS